MNLKNIQVETRWISWSNSTKICLRSGVCLLTLLTIVYGDIQQSSLPHLPSFTKSSISSDSKLSTQASSRLPVSSCKLPPNYDNSIISTAQQPSLSFSMTECLSPSSVDINVNVPTKTIDDFDCVQLDFCNDRLGFEAILSLHRQLDDDANGDIDISESDEFLRDELKYENCAERQKAFHGNDKHITVDELWNSWKVSPVHNWTVEETVNWLCDIIELPKYKDKFLQHSVNGVALPRLAASSQFFNVLGINNPIHKQKLALKAMDVVLFGIPKPNTFVKDVVMCGLIVFAIAVAWYAYCQHKYSKIHIRKMMKDMESLSSAEKQLEFLQIELNRTKQEHETAFKEKRDLERKLKENEQQLLTACNEENCSNNDTRSNLEDQRIMELEKELLQTQNELKRLEQAYASRQWLPSMQLQQYLQLTYEIEIKNYNLKKSAAEMQLNAARDGCDKLKKKRSTLLGAFRMAHGSSIDYVDNTILQARTMLAELTNEMQERIKRWKQVEMFCGFDIIHNPGLLALEQTLYGCNSAISTTASSLTVTTGSKTLLNSIKSDSIPEDDSLSLISASTYAPFMSNHFPANSLKKVSSISSGMYTNYCQQYTSPSFDEDNETSVSSFDDAVSKYSNQSFNKRATNTNVTFCTSSVPSSSSNEFAHVRPKSFNTMQQNQAKNMIIYRRGSSDGVERHFEEIQSSNPKASSQSENSILTNINNNCASCSTSNNNDDNIAMVRKFPELNDETLSSSSDSTIMTVASMSLTDNRTIDLNGNNTNNNETKKRNFFRLRKRKSSKTDKVATEK